MHIRRKTLKRMIHLFLLALIIIPVLLIVLHFSSRTIEAECMDADAGYKYYTTYELKEGDTLWSIAQMNYTEQYADYNAYIDEVKTINHLDGDTVFAGTRLCIPYYSKDYK